MISNTNKYIKHLNFIKKGVINRFGKGKSTNWQNRDFENLSFEINKATKVLISATTLKRIFGKNKTADTYYPQQSTLDALTNYAALSPNKKNFFVHTFHKAYLLLLIIPFGITSLLFLNLLELTSLNNFPPARLELKKIDGTNPATAFFNYEIPNSRDSIFISFGDEHPPQYLEPNKQLISHYYRYPGLFNVHISTRQQVLSDTLKLFIPTDNWQALACYYDKKLRDRYYPIPINLSTSNEAFHPTPRDLANIGMDTTEIIVLSIDNFKKTGISGDTFNLKTRLKNTNFWPSVRCYACYINIVGKDGLIRFKFANKGCSQFGRITLSEKKAHGLHTDLTNFSLDIKNWNDIKIKNNDKQVQVFINSTLIFQDEYNKSIGELLGVSLQFHGNGYVDYLVLQDKNDTSIFEKDF